MDGEHQRGAEGGRTGRRKGHKKLDPEEALKMFVVVGNRLMRESKLTDSASQRAWLKRAVGYLMEKRALTGTVSTERTPIPDGFMPRVGRPRRSKVA